MFSQNIHEQLYKIITEKYKYLQHYAQTDREPEMDVEIHEHLCFCFSYFKYPF